MLEIKQITFTELENNNNFAELTKEYSEEGAIEGIKNNGVDLNLYRTLEAANNLHVLAVFLDTILIGYAILFKHFLHHRSIYIIINDAIFVKKEFRDTGAGLKLLKEINKHSNTTKTVGTFINAPTGSSLINILPNMGYIETGKMFFKKNINE